MSVQREIASLNMVRVSGKINISDENEKCHQLHIGIGKSARDGIKKFTQLKKCIEVQG